MTVLGCVRKCPNDGTWVRPKVTTRRYWVVSESTHKTVLGCVRKYPHDGTEVFREEEEEEYEEEEEGEEEEEEEDTKTNPDE